MASIYVLNQLVQKALADPLFRDQLYADPAKAAGSLGLRLKPDELLRLQLARELIRDVALQAEEARRDLGFAVAMDGCFPTCVPIPLPPVIPAPPRMAVNWSPANPVQALLAKLLADTALSAAAVAERLETEAAQTADPLLALDLRRVAADLRG
ncbi:MAG TPA: hypothetical protein VFV27_02935 [Nevskiaceae bacterium]|nr:hypothetical protein [Nevskiaceae bacterium]